MPLELTKENMLLFFPSWEIPLSDKEINDFLNCEYQEEFCDLFSERKIWVRDLPKKVWKTPATKHYKTKKAIKQDIKIIDDQLVWWLSAKQKPGNNQITIDYCELTLEDLFKEKEKLQEKLRYTNVKFDNDNLATAKQVPISNYIDFQHNTACCVFHSEKTPSMHYYPKENKVKCFGCQRYADVLDVVMELNNCTLPEAIKIILNK